MDSVDRREWFKYCKSLNVNPYNPYVLKSVYYQKGFEEWKRLQREFNYYRYMSYNF